MRKKRPVNIIGFIGTAVFLCAIVWVRFHYGFGRPGGAFEGIGISDTFLGAALVALVIGFLIFRGPDSKERRKARYRNRKRKRGREGGASGELDSPCRHCGSSKEAGSSPCSKCGKRPPLVPDKTRPRRFGSVEL